MGWGEDDLRMMQEHYIYCACYSFIISSVPPQVIRHYIMGAKDPCFNGHLDCFHFGVIMNKGAVNIFMQLFV